MRRFGTGWWDRHYRLVSRLLLAGIILLLLHAIQLKLTPAFHGAAQIAAQNLATELVNEQVAEILQDYDGDFDTIERAEDGRVLSVGLDAVKANLLKAELSQKLTKELDNLAARSISIPLGSILGGPLLNGRGPGIPFVVEPYAFAQVDFEQHFLAAGINQTLYQVQLRVQVELEAALSRLQTRALVDTTFLIEERLIAGEVPQVYLENAAG